MKLCQMRRIDRLITEDSVDGEQLRRFPSLLCDLVQHRCRDGGGVRPQNELRGLALLPWVAVANGAEVAVLMHPSDLL